MIKVKFHQTCKHKNVLSSEKLCEQQKVGTCQNSIKFTQFRPVLYAMFAQQSAISSFFCLNQLYEISPSIDHLCLPLTSVQLPTSSRFLSERRGHRLKYFVELQYRKHAKIAFRSKNIRHKFQKMLWRKFIHSEAVSYPKNTQKLFLVQIC